VSVADATAIGADCVAAHVNLGSRYETEMISALARVAAEGNRAGVPVLAIMYVRDESTPFSSSTESSDVAHAARIGLELGADIIKTQYTGSADSFASVVAAAAPLPVVVAGGGLTTLDGALARARGAIAAGAAGVSYGRNVFQQDDPAAVVRAISDVVHLGATDDRGA
jgi:fructose-bisphosphate aldolase/2-amino-3,7-dideoxy-D-threo-hept-6-ulosonate synthase